MVKHQDMLMCLALIDDATERAAFDYGQEIVTTGVRSDQQTARHDRAPFQFQAQDHVEVPNIVVKGVAAIGHAIEGNELEMVLRQLLEPATPLRHRPDSPQAGPSLGPSLGFQSGALSRVQAGAGRNLGLVERAMEAAVMAHEGQRRKESGGPYIAHPLAVALHLACCGYNEQCIAAALVHDVIEDTEWDEARLDEALGDQAERCRALVRFATEPPKDVSWRTRKSGVVAKFAAGASRDERALVIADKSHNLRSLLRGLRKRGERAWGALRHGRREQSWFAHSLEEAVRYETGEPFRSFVATVEEAVGEGWLDAA